MRLLNVAWMVVLLVAAGCASDKDAAAPPRTGTAAAKPAAGATATIDEAPYIATEVVGVDRLPKERLEEHGEARLNELARRVPVYRLRDQPKAALRYTIDGASTWLAWQPQAVLHARRALARAEGANVAQIQTLDVLAEQWPDACLGLGGPGRSCATVVTPGFRVTLRWAGKTYEYRTDREAQVERASP